MLDAPIVNRRTRLDALSVLANDPVGGGSLALPGLQELFGQGLKLDWVRGGFNRPGQTLLFELLGDRQLNSIGHERAKAAEPLSPGPFSLIVTDVTALCLCQAIQIRGWIKKC